MSPRLKFTKQEIVNATFQLGREKGWSALSTPILASVLGTSARPIYSHSDSMDELEEEIAEVDLELLHTYMIKE